MSDLHRDYLLDLGDEIRRRALEAKAERSALAKGTRDELFQAGRVMAFNEVLSIMLQTAKGLGMPARDIHLEGFEPDRDLL